MYLLRSQGELLRKLTFYSFFNPYLGAVAKNVEKPGCNCPIYISKVCTSFDIQLTPEYYVNKSLLNLLPEKNVLYDILSHLGEDHPFPFRDESLRQAVLFYGGSSNKHVSFLAFLNTDMKIDYEY